jgi:anthranilate synthase/aminodeoxychorismate synthase-like glutamine amidotransferase
MILIVDNYDSFTYNLVQLLAPFGFAAKVIRNDAMSAKEALGLEPDAVILSPGPCSPDEAGICLELVRGAAERDVPLLGVCLGHQAIAQVMGGKVVRAGKPMHGKVSRIRHAGSALFGGIDSPFGATRYHSLSVERASLPNSVEILAEAEDDQEIMALKAAGKDIYGVQYHPESHLSPSGKRLLENFLRIAKVRVPA